MSAPSSRLTASSRWGPRSVIGFAMMGLGTVLWLAVFAVPFLSLELAAAGLLAGGLFVAAEVLWWVGALVAGPTVVAWALSRFPWRRGGS